MQLPKKEKDTFTLEAEKLLNMMLAEIETQACKTRYQSDGAFNAGWQQAFRHMFWFLVDKGIKPVTYNGQLIFEHIKKPSKEETDIINAAIKKASEENVI